MVQKQNVNTFSESSLSLDQTDGFNAPAVFGAATPRLMLINLALRIGPGGGGVILCRTRCSYPFRSDTCVTLVLKHKQYRGDLQKGIDSAQIYPSCRPPKLLVK